MLGQVDCWHFVVEAAQHLVSLDGFSFLPCVLLLLLDGEFHGIWAPASDAALGRPGEEARGDGSITVIHNLPTQPHPHSLHQALSMFELKGWSGKL